MTSPAPDPIHDAESRAAWEDHWRVYDEATRRNPAHRYRRDLILSAIETSPGPHRIVDLGCGQGDFLAEAARRFPEAELAGLDASETGLDLARRRVPRARFWRADFAASAPIPGELHGFATHVVCSEVLEHLPSPEILLRHALAVFAPGAQLVITVPGGPRSAFDIHIGHVRHYSPGELGALLADAGYATISVNGAGFPFFNLYKLAVILRGARLATDIDQSRGVTRGSRLAMAAFGRLFRLNIDRTGLGWQTFGVFAPAHDAARISVTRDTALR